MARSRWSIAASLVAALAAAALPGSALGQSPAASAPAASLLPGGVSTVSDPSFAGALGMGVAAGPDGSFVMVGMKADDPQRPDKALGWRSTDGMTWSPFSLPKGKHESADGVAHIDAGWLAIGSIPFGGGVSWISSDGIKWKPGKLKGARYAAVIGTPAGAVVAGYTLADGKTHPMVYRSGDLAKWKSSKVPGAGLPTAIAETSSGVTLVLLGDSKDVDGARVTSYAYGRSADGKTFEAADFPVTPASADEVVFAGDLGVAGDLFVQLIGVRKGGAVTGSIWTSPDGLAWTKAFETGKVLSLVADGSTGDVIGDGLRVTSPDGLAWTATDQPGLTTAGRSAAVASDGSVATAGYHYDGGFSVSLQVLPSSPDFVPSAPSVAPSSSPGAVSSPAASGAPVGDGPSYPL